MILYMCVLVSHVRLFLTPWTLARQAPLSMEFSRQEYWSGLPFSSLQGIFLTQGSNPGLLHCRRSLYHLSHQGSPYMFTLTSLPESESERCSVVSDSATPWTIQSMEFSRPEYWSGSLSLFQGIFLTQIGRAHV